MLLAQVTRDAYDGVNRLIRHELPDYVAVGDELQAMTPESGGNLAVVGYPFDAYYAWYSGTRVLAHVPDAAAFWDSSAEQREALLRTMAANDIDAIVARNPPPQATLEGWREVRTARSLFVIRKLSTLRFARSPLDDGRRLPRRTWARQTSTWPLGPKRANLQNSGR
jgi:hypothetical protein